MVSSSMPDSEKWSDSLDEKLYDLDEVEKAFFKAETGIEDDEELKRHIMDTKAKAFAVSYLS